MILVLIHFIIFLLIIGLLWFLVSRAPFIPAEIKVVINYIFLLIVVLFLVYLLLPYAGVNTGNLLR